MKTIVIGAAMAALALGATQAAPQAAAPSGPTTLNPTGFPYPDAYDSVRAAPAQHKLLYEDDKVRLLEVTYLPHTKGQAMHGHPYPSVFAFPSERPAGKDTRLNDLPPAPRTLAGGPDGQAYPTCTTMGAQSPHQPENQGDFPDHFYRVEFKRVDGADFAKNWRTWYPYMTKRTTLAEWLKTTGKRPFGQANLDAPRASGDKATINPKEYPYPDKTDSVVAAPGQHWLRYQDRNIRFLEVIYRPGELGDAMHGHPFSSVFAFDTTMPPGQDQHLDAARAEKEKPTQGGPPPGMSEPTCMTMGPQSPHRPFNPNAIPQHFYRIEFRRLDGAGIKDHWKEWYPEMARKAGH